MLMKNTPNPIKMKSFTCTYYKSNTIVPRLCDRHLTYNGGKKKPTFFLLIKIFQTFSVFTHDSLLRLYSKNSPPSNQAQWLN